MYRNFKVWFLRTVATLFKAVMLTIPVCLVVINHGYAQLPESTLSDGGWDIAVQGNSSLEGNPATSPAGSVNEANQGSEDEVVDQSPTDTAPIATANSVETKFVGEPLKQIISEATEQPTQIPQVESELTINNLAPLDPELVQESTLAESALIESSEPEAQLTAQEKAQVEAITDLQLTRDLEQQFGQLQQSLQTEDAFSSKLGENYLGYGKLLRKAGQIDESIKALTTALHIAKVNNGIYSIEQRPALRELFEIHYDLDSTEDFEDYLERILWVENRNPESRDNSSYELLLKVGNRYIDNFLRKPIAGQASLEMLLRAKFHLITAVRVFGKTPVSEMLMPYGELALISFLQSKVSANVDQTASLEDSRLRKAGGRSGRELTLASYFEDPFPKGEAFLLIYLRKAQKEGSTEHVVRALKSLGDLNQLFGRYSHAGSYYELAWLAEQDLDQSQVGIVSFSQPTLLPDFDYAYQRYSIPSNRETVSVALILRIGSDGRVKNVQRANPEDGLEKYFPRARRAVKRLVFRPQFVDSKAVVTEQFEHTTKVRLK